MGEQLKFAPFSSALDSGFWHKLSQLKLDVYGLDDKTKPIHGFFYNGDAPGLPCRLNVDYTAFDELARTPPRHFTSRGLIKNTNTLDEFKDCDKKTLLDQLGQEMWDDITSGRAISDPSLLSRFFLLTFADLKKYHYYYWFAFPALCAPDTITLTSPPRTLTDRFTPEQINELITDYSTVVLPGHQPYFVVCESEGRLYTAPLSDIDRVTSQGKCILGVCDPCTLDGHPGWPLRPLLTLAAYHWCDKLGDEVEVLCLRDRTKDGRREAGHSIIMTVKLDSLTNTTECPRVVGWEKNEKQKLAPRKVNLSASMDPARLAESAVDLNLKLMRWRLLPDLDLDRIAASRCLLLGSGTLGCNVARNLLAWGMRNVTLVDNGHVSYSNPVRQSLFTFSDSLDGGKHKAMAAAESLRQIFPGVNARGVNLSIPMPGHAVTDSMVEQTRKDVDLLVSLVEEHDVIFLLMDTRESRWLPSLLARVHRKIVINAALGFDTFLVVRHGVRRPAAMDTDDHRSVSEVTASSAGQSASGAGQSASGVKSLERVITGDELGCYFCNDVVAPGNSTRDRTLDQQCTVSRPGMSMITSALAVELLVSLLQHPDGPYAPADTSVRDDHLTKDVESPLGLVPHQIRGFLSRYHQMLPANRAFTQCTACSQLVEEKYVSGGFEFLLDVFNKPSYLEDVTGLSKLHMDTLDAEVWELSDDEDSAEMP